MPVEVIACSVEDALAAARGGASRLEICEHIGVGGVTPSVDLVRAILDAVSLPVVAMVRVRPGDFFYSPQELEDSVRQAKELAELSIQALVFGALLEDRTIDSEAVRRIAEHGPVVFHRAFDHARDPFEALDTVSETGCVRILTSGHAPTALDGATILDELRQRSDAIEILPGGSIRPDNAAELRRRSGCDWMHFSANVPKDGGPVSEALVRETLWAWELAGPSAK